MKSKYYLLRELWFKYFVKILRHKKIPSTSLISNDKSLLWTNSGISGIKKYFFDTKLALHLLMTNIQPCIRTNDLNMISHSYLHHSFFEMMGHFVIKNSNKKFPIEAAWNFLTKPEYLNFDINNLYVTVYENDYETIDIWLNIIKINKSHIIYNSKKYNFWNLGIGPCGPNTEIFYDCGESNDPNKQGINLLKKNISNNRYVEIWNIVFSEFYNDGNNNFTNLKHKGIDVGAGLERLLSIFENVENNFSTSIFHNALNVLKKYLPQKIINKEKFIIFSILDFSRTITFILNSNITISNKSHGSMLKKLINLFVVNILKLKIKKIILSELIKTYIEFYKDIYLDFLNFNFNYLDEVNNYAKQLIENYIVYFKEYWKIKKIQNLELKLNNFEIHQYKKKLFEKFKYLYFPKERFHKYSTHGKWNLELKEITDYIFDFLEISLFDDTRFTLMMPPANVTGVLHLGHAYELILSDLLMRELYLNKKNAIFFIGTDHAGIATQIKLNNYFKNENIDTNNLLQDKYLALSNNWVEKVQTRIFNCWNQLGIIYDNNNLNYTLNPISINIVNFVFKLLYEKKLIYKANQLVNYDCKLQTAISDLEVDHKKENSYFFYIKYFFADNNKKFLSIATTRPETIFADVALFVNPKDERYKNYINKFVINPLNKKKILILTDKKIKMDFGTGIVKCTPGHDFDDYELMRIHNLPIISCINFDGKMNDNCEEFSNLTIKECRKKVLRKLKNTNYLIKEEKITNFVPYSSRSNSIIEPLISEQWFIDLKAIADDFLKEDFNNNIKFYDSSYLKKFKYLLSNIKEWCISRQIKWGIRMPIWYDKENNKNIYVGTNPPQNYIQETSVLDTWFSSALWPLVITKFNHDEKFFKNFYPLTLVLTGYDLLFFWISKMILLCNWVLKNSKLNFLLVSRIPFKKVFFHGLLRDKNNIKMSKSNNNGVDPLFITKKYGNDLLRMFLILEHNLHLDVNFNEDKLIQWNKYLKKIESIYLFFQKYNNSNINLKKIKKISNDFYSGQYILNKFILFIKEMNSHAYSFKNENQLLINNKKYLKILHFINNDFSHNYLNHLKYYLISNDKNIFKYKNESLLIIKTIFSELLIMLFPLCPFYIDEIFHKLNNSSISNYSSIFFPENLFLFLNNKHRYFENKEISFFSSNLIEIEIIDNLNNDLYLFLKNHIILEQKKDNDYLVYISVSSLCNDKKYRNFIFAYLHSINFLNIKNNIKINFPSYDDKIIHSLKFLFLEYKDKKTTNGIYFEISGILSKENAEKCQKILHESLKKIEIEINILKTKINKFQKLLIKFKNDHLLFNTFNKKIKEINYKIDALSNNCNIINNLIMN